VIFEQISIIYQLPRLFVGSFTLVLPYFPTGTGQHAAYLPLHPLAEPCSAAAPPLPLLPLSSLSEAGSQPHFNPHPDLPAMFITSSALACLQPSVWRQREM
jgi:hypothetical protein